MDLPEWDRRRKERIARGFARSAATYDRHAGPQREAAQVLLAQVEAWRARLPTGPVLEIGCGTGGLSEGLVPLLPQREIWFTDLSAALLEACRQRLLAVSADAQGLHWQVMDGEMGPIEGGYALIVSGMTLHWFADWAGALQRWLRALRPGGVLLCSFQEAGSFPEWRAQCRRLELPCTANVFPALQQVQQALGQGRCWVREEAEHFASARVFFRSLKETGTATSLGGEVLGAGAFRRLLRAWDQACPGGVEERVCCGFAVVQRG